MNNIFQTLLYQREKQKDTVLATIVWDDGSAPRGAGSQMLVGAEGLLSGTIGGGAVDAAVHSAGPGSCWPVSTWTPCMTSSSPVTVSWAWPAAAM